MIMNRFVYIIGLLAILLFTGCELVGDIFKAGVWSGVLLVVAVVGGILYLLTRGRRRP
jgi:hypothetical protein